MRPFSTRIVPLRGVRYHFYVWGENLPAEAPTLLCLHGWGDLGASFQFLVDALPADWRILAPDWRGFGRSQHNAGPYWFPDYLGDLDALLEWISPDQPVNLLGHSMGGIVASLYAGIRPLRINRLILLEGLVLWSEKPERSPERCAAWLDALRKEDVHFRSYSSPDEFAARLRRDNPRLSPERARFIAAHAVIETPERRFVFSADPKHRWPTPALFPLADAQACWRAVRAPTCSLLGDDSSIMRHCLAKPEEYAARRACFRTLQEVTIADCGHNLHHDQPACVAAHIVDLMRS